MSSPADLTLGAAAASLRDGTLSASELLQATLDRATLTEAELHAYLTIAHEGARAAAAAADEALCTVFRLPSKTTWSHKA